MSLPLGAPGVPGIVVHLNYSDVSHSERHQDETGLWLLPWPIMSPLREVRLELNTLLLLASRHSAVSEVLLP